METSSHDDAGQPLGWRGIALWYAIALTIGLFPIFNTLFGYVALVFAMALLMILGALLLRNRMVTIAAGHLIIGLLIAGTSWWFVTAMLISFD